MDGEGVPEESPFIDCVNANEVRCTDLNENELRNELKERMKSVRGFKALLERDIHTRKEFVNPEGSYLNPDAWSRLIGKSNTAPVFINGIECKALLDTGAHISFISKRFAKSKGLKIHPIEQLVNFQGANGLGIEYSGYVEINLQIPERGIDEDILLLVVPHIQYHNYVPVTLGTLTLELINQHFVDSQQVQDLDANWGLVNKVLEFRHSFTEDESLGIVKTTKSVKIPANEVISISGLTKIKKGVIVCTLPKEISLAESQYVNLDHGSSRVGILLKNNTDQAITLPSKTVICQLGIANLVPKLVAPQSEYEDEEIDPDLFEDPDIDYNAFKAYAAQASASAGNGGPEMDEPTPCTATPVEDDDDSWLLEKIDLSGIDDWPVSLQQQARDLFKRYSHAFSKDDLDLGRAKMVKHYIKLSDPIPSRRGTGGYLHNCTMRSENIFRRC